MIPRPDDPDRTALLRDVTVIDRAVAEAQAEAIRRHHLLGEPVAIWRDGRVVEVPAPAPEPEASGRG